DSGRRMRILAGLWLVCSSQAGAALIPLHQLESGPVRLRVRIREAVPEVRLRGYDLRVAGRHRDRRSQWTIRCERGAVTLKGTETLRSRDPVEILSPGGFVFVDGRPYRDGLRIHARPDGRCDVV